MDKIKEILKQGVPRELLALFQFDLTESDEKILLRFDLWGRYFFPQYFKSDDAEFHFDINSGNLAIYRGTELDAFIDIAFRGAGKDVKTQLFIAFVILNDKNHFRRYFKCLSEDLDNAIQSVTDIYNMLVNPKIAKIYPKTFERTAFKKVERQDAFDTSTGIKVIADGLRTSQRGAKQEEARPDFVWFNDFENRKTLRSITVSKDIWDNMEEARTGLEKGGGCVYTCNYISELGNVHKLVTEKLSPRKLVLIVPILKDGVPVWDRYSLEDIAEMKATDDDFEGERMCKPDASKDIYFDRDRLERMPVLQPIKEVGGFKIYKEYTPDHRYAGGQDVAGGVGLDSCASVIIDFSTVPAQVVATFHSNTIKPEAFGDEIYAEGNRYGGCLMAPENNKFDSAVLKAKQLGTKLYMARSKANQIGGSEVVAYGWNTNSLTKSTMFLGLQKAVEDGLIELNDKDLIQEAKSYTRNDIIDRSPDPRDVTNATRHFDLLTACAIAWQMNSEAKVAPVKKKVDAIWKKEVINPAL